MRRADPRIIRPVIASLDDIVNLAKRRGFVFPASEIYGGFRSAYDYGPLGVELLRNVKEQWWRSMVQQRQDIPPESEPDGWETESSKPDEPSTAPLEPPKSAPPPEDSSGATNDGNADAEADADAPPERRAPTRGEPGFYLRAALGPGYAWAQTDRGIEFEGMTVDFMTNVGGTVARGLALHADLFVLYRLVLSGGADLGDTRVEKVTQFGAGFVGAGATYHLMPWDLLFGGGAGLSLGAASRHRLTQDGDGDLYVAGRTGATGPGFAAHATVGKLWPLARRWALGFSVHYAYLRYGKRQGYEVNLRDTHTLWLGVATAFGK